MCKLSIALSVIVASCMTYSQSWAAEATTIKRATTAPVGIDLMLGADHQLPVNVTAGQPIVFWNQTGTPLEVTESGRVLMRPGVYSVQVGDQITQCRIWAHGTAPPSAVSALPVVRGQNHQQLLWNLDALTPPAIIITGLGLGLWAALDSAS